MRKRVVPRRLRPWLVPIGVAGVLLAGAVPAMAGTLGPTPIGPNQAFVGVVNGSSTVASIGVRCDLTTDATRATAHPVAGQKVSVTQVVTTPGGTGDPVPGLGFTGNAGRLVGVSFGSDAGTKPPVALRVYDQSAEIPTDVVVPCGGSGVVTFSPIPGSPNSRPAAVKVTFVPVP